MLALDTDVLAIYHIFHNDPRYLSTKEFLEGLLRQTKAVTIFNLLELCGILATAGRKEDSDRIFKEYLGARDIAILFPNLWYPDGKDFWSALVSDCFSRIQRGLRLGDAVILWVLETNSQVDAFVTWNTKHFQKKTSMRIISPLETEV